MPMRPPDYDRKPLYHDGVGVGWVGYGMFDEWPSASFRIFVWKDFWRGDDVLDPASSISELFHRRERK